MNVLLVHKNPELAEVLEKAYGERSGYMTTLNCDPAFDELRSDRRLHKLIRRIGLPGILKITAHRGS